MKSRQHGSSLAVTLMVGALVVVFVFMLAAVAFFQLTVSTRAGAAETARNLAESTLAVATSQFMQAVKNGQQDYGTHRETVHFQYAGSPPDETGTLSFDQAQTLVPWSLNNVPNLSAVQGSTHRVPGGSIDLVAMGRCGSEMRTAEAILYIPEFTQALAAASTVHSNGGLLVGGIAAGQGPVGTYNPAQLLPADVVSNSSDPAAAISLGPSSHVTGNVQAVGQVVLDGAMVDGQVKSFYSPSVLPQLDVTSFDTAGRPHLQILGPGQQSSLQLPGGPVPQTQLPSLPLTGFARCAGNLEIMGDLQLNDGVLYVAGNLLVHGATTGKGALITTGTMEIDGASQLSSDNQVALLSQGDVTLGGTGPNGSAVQGLMYTEGMLRAHDLSLVGVFVANGQNGGLGTMQVDNVNVVLNPDMTNLVLGFVPELPGFTQSQVEHLGVKLDFDLTATDIQAASALPPGATLQQWLTVMHPQFEIGSEGSPAPSGVLSSQSFFAWLQTQPQLLAEWQNPTTPLHMGVLGWCQAAYQMGVQAGLQPDSTFSVDLNQFISPEQTIRTLYWHLL